MKLLRYKENGKLYYIENFTRDIHHLNHNTNCGVFAHGYNHNDTMKIGQRGLSSEQIEQLINFNFTLVSEI